MERLKNALALFDVDHTLSEDSFTVLDFADFLNRKKLFHKRAFKEMEVDYEAFVQQVTPISYRDFAVSIIDHFSVGLKGRRRKNIFDAGKCFFPSVYIGKLARLRGFSLNLVSTLNRAGVETMIVSGAPKEVALPLARFLRIGRIFHLEAGINKGYYSGRTKVNMALDEEKEKVAIKLREIGYNQDLSFAFGDNSGHDKPILEAVGNPFFVLCKHNLGQEQTALKYGWTVVDENSILEQVGNRLATLGGFPAPE